MNTENLTLDSFVDGLIEEKGLGTLDPEVRDQVAHDLKSRVEDRINAAIITHVPQDKIAEFNTLLDEGSETKIHEFITASVPKGDETIAETLMSFRSTYLNG